MRWIQIIFQISLIPVFIKCNLQEVGNFVENNVLIKQYFYNQERVVWSEVEDKCEAFGMEPLELLTKVEQNNFITIAKEHSFVQKNEFIHIGGAKCGKKWVWIKSLKKLDYSAKWLPGEPNHPTNEKCLSIIFLNNRLGLNDITCEGRALSYFCQKTVQPDVVNSVPKCPKHSCPKISCRAMTCPTCPECPEKTCPTIICEPRMDLTLIDDDIEGSVSLWIQQATSENPEGSG